MPRLGHDQRVRAQETTSLPGPPKGATQISQMGSADCRDLRLLEHLIPGRLGQHQAGCAKPARISWKERCRQGSCPRRLPRALTRYRTWKNRAGNAVAGRICLRARHWRSAKEKPWPTPRQLPLVGAFIWAFCDGRHWAGRLGCVFAIATTTCPFAPKGQRPRFGHPPAKDPKGKTSNSSRF